MTSPILRAIEGHARRNPDGVAIEARGEPPCTWIELTNRAALAAGWLAEHGAVQGSKVLFAGGRGMPFVECLLGAWHLGAIFVPMAPDLPARAGAALAGRVAPVLSLDRTDGAPWRDGKPIGRAPTPLTPLSPAYICFTSGSSGEPKGAILPHRGLLPLAEAQIAAFLVSPKDRTSWALASHFDASFSDVLVPLVAGATLVILPEGGPALPLAAGAERLTHIDLPPSQLGALLAHGIPETLRTIIVGGEVADRSALRRAAESVRVLNVYGPTETTVCASIEHVTRDATDAASIGRPIDGTVFRFEGSSADQGELLIGGVGVALSYLDHPELSASSFTVVEESRFYRTGDLVRREPDGTFTFLGRVDRQVQVRGKRFEPEELERVLMRHPGVMEAAVTVTRDAVGAFVRPVDLAAKPLAAWCAERLETWKRPSFIEPVAELPRLANGKVDHGALARKEKTRRERSRPAAARVAAVDHPLAQAWKVVFQLDAVTDDDDFEERGGDSVRALELSVEAARRGVVLEPADLSTCPRLGDLFRHVATPASVDELRRRAVTALHAVGIELASQPHTQPASQPGNQPGNRFADAQSHGGPGTVLLTGSTGLVGPWLIDELLSHGRRVLALVRAADQASAEARLGAATGLQHPELFALRGDVTLDGLGIGATDRDALAGVTAVVHLAGSVHLAAGYGELADINVAGTARALRLARDLGAEFHHASSLSVFAEGEPHFGEADTSPRIIHSDHDLAAARRVHGGYAQSKWVAEAAVGLAQLPGTIARLGLLTGAPRSGAPPRDQLSRVIRGLARLGTWPIDLDDRRFDVTPVGAAARAMAGLIQAPPHAPARSTNIARAVSATGAQLFDAMAAEGVAMGRASTWPPRQASHGDLDVAVALAATTARQNPGELRLPRSGDLFLATDLTFAVHEAARLTDGALGLPPTAQELRSLVRGALQEL